MGQTNLIRTHFKAREECTTPQSSAQQAVAKTCFFVIGDTVDVIDVDANGNVTAVLADNLTILGVVTDQEVALSASVDTTAAVGTPMIVNQSIDDGQAALVRALCKPKITGPVAFDLLADILDKGLNEPSAGKTTYDIADASFWRSGDLVDVYDNTGLILSDAAIDSVNINADDVLNKATIVINALQDVTLPNTPFLVNKTITVQKAILRNQERLDEIDRPIINENKGWGEGTLTVWEANTLFVQGSTDFNIDGRKQTLGTAGTRSTLVQGTGNAALTFTSNILGILGDEIEVEVQAGAGFAITVSRTFKVNAGGNNFSVSEYLIQINDNGGAATSQGIADALNADATVRRIMYSQWGGDGTGVVSTFGPSNLSGGLNNGTGDYAELEQLFENSISTVGFKLVSSHIRPNERDGLNEPMADDEYAVLGYSKAADNVDR